MRLLHTSDWHLGRMTYNVSRAPDHDAVLAEIVDIARRERPDLILHTGDLFDTVRPAYSEMERGINVLKELAAIAPTIVLCGNHDSPALFRLFQLMAGSETRLRFVEKPRLPEDGGIIDVEVANGQRVRVAPVPFIHANRFVEAFVEPTEVMTTYADHVAGIARTLDAGLQKGYDGTRDILIYAAHLHVAGAMISRTEHRLHVTDMYATLPEHLPTVSYAAFGHIHKPQMLPGGRGAYAGSPIELDFGELGEEKRVVMVEASPGRPARIDSIPLRTGRRLRQLAGTMDEIAAAAANVGTGLTMVTVRTEIPTPGLSERVRTLLPDATILDVIEDCPALRANVVTRDSIPATEPDTGALFEEYLGVQPAAKATAADVLRVFSEFLAAAKEERLATFDEKTFAEVAE